MKSFLILAVWFFNGVTSIEVIERKDKDIFERDDCAGTTVGFGYSGTLEYHYKYLKKRYQGCTHIHGNLEITNLVDHDINYDLSFLSEIRYVSGYVLIGLVTEVFHVPLTSLEIVRGNSTYRIQGDDYSFIVALTSRYGDTKVGLRALHMPALREISEGKVMFKQNPALCYVDTISWDTICRGRNNSVAFLETPFSEDCDQCSDNCQESETEVGGCWSTFPEYCARGHKQQCDESCPERCFGPSSNQCCHSQCAVGCSGPTESDCVMCKDFNFNGECRSFCPDGTYPMKNRCITF
ncbi:epidermal growth factor receptor-like [Gigantopelta aegis]|uniref:epidermal growth factor receptor-like n=1 Tax=Gigantopelta aegis TaxID=1735272 RepID=UPI001B88C9BB|nr:epidermal growth factor receptor-like [Gigantopelta aegis]